jgi:hypothetical protein
MRYINLRLGRSDYRPQEWTIGVGPLKEMGLRTGSRPVPVAVQVHSRKPPAYKSLYKLRGLSDGSSPSLAMDQVHSRKPPTYKSLYKLRGLSYRSCPSPVTILLLVGELDG